MAIKSSSLTIAASLAANTALVALIAVRAPWLFRLHSTDPNGPVAAALAKPASAGPTGGRLGEHVWDALSEGDLKSTAARLRAAGFPPEVVRAIIKARLDAQFLERRKELTAKLGPRPYWNRRFGNFDPKTMAGLNSLNREESKAMKDVLGAPDEPTGYFGVPLSQDPTSGLSRQKFDRVQAITSDFNDMRTEIYGNANGVILPEDQEKLDYLQKEQQAEIEAELTPGELLEYQLRSSPEANQLRYRLGVFNPSEDEFRAIFKAQQEFNAQYGSAEGSLTPERQQEREAHQPELLAKIQDSVGPDRMADYKQQTDPNYVQASRLVERLALPASATQALVTVQSDITKRADAIRRDPSLSAADKSSQLSTLSDEATGRLSAVMGDRGMAAYKQNGGWWLQSLKLPSN